MESVSGTGLYNGSVGLLDGLKVDGASSSAIGIYILANATDGHQKINLCNFGSMTSTYCGVGVQVEASESGGFSGSVNGNTFDDIMTSGCVTHVYYTAGSGTEVSGNFVKTLQMQYQASTTNGVKLDGDTWYNRFPNIMAWDWGDVPAVNFGADTHYCYAAGNFKNYTVINNTNTIANRQAPREAVWLLPERGWPSTTDNCTDTGLIEMANNKQNYYVFDFVHTATTYAEWTEGCPWAGVNITTGKVAATFYWTCAETGSGGVRWEIQSMATSDSSPLDGTWGTAVGVTDDKITVDDLHISDPVVMTIAAWSNPGVNLIQYRVYRDHDHDDDTLARTVSLLAVKIDFNISEN